MKQTTLEKINMLQRQIIIHSIIYYILNDNIWTDTRFDEACNELVELKKNKVFKKSEFYEDFKDFEGETGMHLASQFRASMEHIAYRVFKYHQRLQDER